MYSKIYAINIITKDACCIASHSVKAYTIVNYIVIYSTHTWPRCTAPAPRPAADPSERQALG